MPPHKRDNADPVDIGHQEEKAAYDEEENPTVRVLRLKLSPLNREEPRSGHAAERRYQKKSPEGNRANPQDVRESILGKSRDEKQDKDGNDPPGLSQKGKFPVQI